MPATRTRPIVVSVLLVLTSSLLGSGLVGSGRLPANAAGGDPFRSDQAYRGDFPDPTVWREGRRFYAASTSVVGLTLPLMSSTDLRTWVPRPVVDPADPRSNDAMPRPPSWALTQTTRTGRVFTPTWAPSVFRSSGGTHVAAYSMPRLSDGRRCISLARSASAIGPYVDASSAPLTCGSVGAIDPQIFADRGAVWLLYSLSGTSAQLRVRQLNRTITGFAVGSRDFEILRPKLAWEGHVLENPAMIRFRKRLYLVYSANDYATTRYATGYAVCKRVTGRCKRMGRLLGSTAYLAGPGGAEPFLDLSNNLRLVFHAWTPGNVGYPLTDACRATVKGCAQRRMHVAQVTPRRRGALQVRGWF